MGKMFLSLVVLIFLAPVGALAQSAAVVTFTNPNEALAYNELMRVCGMTKNNAVSFFKGKYGDEKNSAVEKRMRRWRGVASKNSIAWMNTIAEMILVEKKSPEDVYLNCMMKGRALHPYGKKRVENIRAGKIDTN